MKKSQNPEKESAKPRSKVQIYVMDVRPMTADEERRFTAAIDALLSEFVYQELSRNGGEYAGTKRLLERP